MDVNWPSLCRQLRGTVPKRFAATRQNSSFVKIMRPNKSYEQRGRNSAQVEHIYDWNNCGLWDIYEFISKIVMNKKYQ